MAASSNIAITHADTGLVTAEVVRAEQVSPHFVRVTIGGDEVSGWRDLGFDQWFRLAVPTNDHTRFDNLPGKFDTPSYLKYLLLLPKATKPVFRNYTVAEFRADAGELDIDFVVHGTDGVAAPWAASLPVGQHVALIDQGCGYRHVDGAEQTVLVGDETALPAIAGILRDLPRGIRGHAVIEVPDVADQRPLAGPDGVEVHWIVRSHADAAGSLALERLASLEFGASTDGFAAGESKLATGARRLFVNERGVPKTDIDFCGYWKAR
ncbi:SIP domain-containing protein [Agromyces seonyuensis]|uniref:Siderophore-interacting protein n=1 Tax=Agromyces seonyuensis TaxID=2662446 RepID=A0A6I4P8E3_9MICO|nr:siderophore-interacting protein [Agromyces seonyuensis]